VRIAVVNQHPSVALGGSETQCDLIATGLAERGHAVRYVAIGGVDPDLAAPGYEVSPVDRSASAVSAAILAHRTDVVYWRAGTDLLAGSLRRLRRAGTGTVPKVVFAASHVNDVSRWRTPPSARPFGPARSAEIVRDRMRSARNHHALLRTDGLVVNNEAQLDLVDVRPRRFIANGVAAGGAPFEWPRPYVAWVANLKPQKRPEALLGLAEALADLGVDVVMAGRVQVESYRWFEDASRLPANLHHLGPLASDRVNGLLAAALLHVHTCEPEGFSNVFIQAWHAGRPSVSLGFDPEGVIARLGLGAVCEDDERRFHAEVRRLVEDAVAREAAGARARTFALERFDTARNVAALEEFLTAVVS
jgi:glycosyltransferase involved in cell wall biosynthesis